MTDRLMFSSAVEGLLVHGVGDLLTPELKNELRETGIDLGKPLLPAYPIELWLKVTELLAKKAFKGLSEKEAYFQMGKRTVQGVNKTLIGKAAFALAKVLGTRRVLMRLPHSFRNSSNFEGVEVHEVAPTAMTLTMTPYLESPDYMLGALTAIAEQTGAKNISVEVTEKSEERAVFQVRWTASG